MTFKITTAINHQSGLSAVIGWLYLADFLLLGRLNVKVIGRRGWRETEWIACRARTSDAYYPRQ